MPDHSILSANVIVRHAEETHSPKSNDKSLENSQVLNERMHLKHKCENLPSNFMNNDEILTEVNRIIDYLEMHEVCQENIDNLLKKFVLYIYYNEVDEKLRYFDNGHTKKRDILLNHGRTKRYQIYLMNTEKQKKTYLKRSHRLEKSRLLANFRSKRSSFDKEYRKAKRAYDETMKIGIAEDETKKPKEF